MLSPQICRFPFKYKQKSDTLHRGTPKPWNPTSIFKHAWFCPHIYTTKLWHIHVVPLQLQVILNKQVCVISTQLSSYIPVKWSTVAETWSSAAVQSGSQKAWQFRKNTPLCISAGTVALLLSCRTGQLYQYIAERLKLPTEFWGRLELATWERRKFNNSSVREVTFGKICKEGLVQVHAESPGRVLWRILHRRRLYWCQLLPRDQANRVRLCKWLQPRIATVVIANELAVDVTGKRPAWDREVVACAPLKNVTRP
jgi:hypothetical protein